jgi:hypothetical protein
MIPEACRTLENDDHAWSYQAYEPQASLHSHHHQQALVVVMLFWLQVASPTPSKTQGKDEQDSPFFKIENAHLMKILIEMAHKGSWRNKADNIHNPDVM